MPAGIPALNSNPGAPATLYLDFDGHYEASWGAYSNITTPAFNHDGDASSFGEAEVALIRTAWARVAEDFAPFNVNVTTVEPAVLAAGVPAANANGKALRVSIGGESTWYGTGYGGVGYINSFTSSVPNVCFVFDSNNDGPAWWFGNTISHEAGHSFGLQHQSTFDANGVELLEYNPGDRSTWNPIMGTSYFESQRNVWYNGTTLTATTLQDDLAQIARSANGFGYRADDHGNTAAAATALTVAGNTWAGTGLVGTNADVDYFSFTVTAADTYRMAVSGPGDAANLDAVLELRNASGQFIEAASPATSLDASIVRMLSPGSYRLAVKSTGVYGWIGSYTVGIDAPPAGITVTPAAPVMSTHEDGRTTSFTVVLHTAPTVNVVIPVSSTNPGEATVSTTSLVFTPANWNVPQTVTITGVADGVVDGDAAFTVVLGPAASADGEYSGRDPDDIAAVNVDADEAGFLYFADGVNDVIGRARLNGGAAEPLVDLKAAFGPADYGPYGVAVDVAGGRVYWIDMNTDAVYRANLDGSGAERILALPAGSPRSVALDLVGGKVYWTDMVLTAKKIWRANLDGSNAETVLTSTAGSPVGIAVDSAAGKMYWTEYASGSPGTVRRANLDGSAIETLWVGDTGSSSAAIALDVAAGKMYWVNDSQDVIYRAGLDGSGVEVVVNGGTISAGSYIRGLALDPAGGAMYWQDFGSQSIYRAGLDGSNVASLAAVSSSWGMAVGHLPPGISVTGHTGLVTFEGGGGASFRVMLTAKPAANVTFSVSSNDATEGTVSVTSLTFTPANWNVPQTVTITSVEDAAVDGNVPYTVVLGAATSADPAYHGLNPADAAVTNNDNDSVKFFTVDDASTDRTYRYGAVVNGQGNSTLGSGNTAPRGAASTAAGDKVWVVDANKKVYVYSAAGTLLGSWTANSLASNATVEGITVHGSDVWIVDARQDRVYRYANAAGRLSGSQSAAGYFQLHANNVSPKDLVTDGTSVWVVDDQVLDKVYKYTLAGTYVGAWAIDPANGSPTGITLDPANPRHLWVVDSGTDRVYQYTDAVARTSGTFAANASYALAAGNTNPQGIADPPPAAEPESQEGRIVRSGSETKVPIRSAVRFTAPVGDRSTRTNSLANVKPLLFGDCDPASRPAACKEQYVRKLRAADAADTAVSFGRPGMGDLCPIAVGTGRRATPVDSDPDLLGTVEWSNLSDADMLLLERTRP